MSISVIGLAKWHYLVTSQDTMLSGSANLCLAMMCAAMLESGAMCGGRSFAGGGFWAVVPGGAGGNVTTGGLGELKIIDGPSMQQIGTLGSGSYVVIGGAFLVNVTLGDQLACGSNLVGKGC